MDRLVSVRERIFIRIIATAHKAAELAAKSPPVSSAINPGLRMINMPRKPAAIASHLYNRNFSPNTTMLKTAMKIGAVKLKAVTFAKGGDRQGSEEHQHSGNIDQAAQCVKTYATGSKHFELGLNKQRYQECQAEEVSKKSYLKGGQIRRYISDCGMA